MSDTYNQALLTEFTTIRWSLGDIIDMAATKGIEMTFEQAAEWADRHKRTFVDRSVELGNQLLDDLLDMDG